MLFYKEFFMDKENRILLFGGTFNPIHNGHLIMAQEAVETLLFNQVIFIPSAIPPHKDDVLSVYHRLKMTRLACDEVNHFKVSDVEEKREGPSFTYDTVMHFKEKYPNSEIYWLIGGDTIPELKTWYKIEELINECKFVIAERNPYKLYKSGNKDLFNFLVEETKPFLEFDYMDHFIPLVNSVIDISSTDIRNKVSQNDECTIKFLVPEKVEQYIYDNSIYRDKSEDNPI
jgi:nicotinate-nucleotide adenylyltransferase